MHKKNLFFLLGVNLFFFNSNSMFKKATMIPRNSGKIFYNRNTWLKSSFLGTNQVSYKPLLFSTLISDPRINNHIKKEEIDTLEFDTTRGTNIMKAAFSGSNFKIKLLLFKGTDVNQINFAGNTALHYAIANNQFETVQLLLEYGADVNALNFQGEAPLLFAALTNNEEIAQLLIDNGANIHARTRFGVTPLFAAALKGHLNLFIMLLKNGGNVTDKDIYGLTISQVAYDSENQDIIRIIKELNSLHNDEEKAIYISQCTLNY